MKYLWLALRWIWTVLFVANFVLTMLVLYPFFRFFLLREKWFPIVFKLKRLWAHMIIFDVGVFYSIKQEAPIDEKQAYVFCPNHTSYLDVVLSYIAIPNYFLYMGKEELRKAPLFGVFFKDMNIAVNRKSTVGAHKAFLKAGDSIEKGASIAIFPEGTISENAPNMIRFKNGPFKLAISKQVPIVPITFKNNWKILPDGKYTRNGGRPGIARIVLHKPIPTAGLTDDHVDALKQQVFDIIQNELAHAN